MKYKESFDRHLKGQRPRYNPLDCLSFKHTQAAAALASQVTRSHVTWPVSHRFKGSVHPNMKRWKIQPSSPHGESFLELRSKTESQHSAEQLKQLRRDLKQRNNQRNVECLQTARLLWSQSAGETRRILTIWVWDSTVSCVFSRKLHFLVLMKSTNVIRVRSSRAALSPDCICLM